ncbi:MAG TPA: 4-hydroxybutyrate CoA-transferase [Syntrophus sp. (in: bacteria)]|nr:4-hydroxybutyrate CoA-transferase [Syntrophus sp. (in: bacteria)]
MQDWRKIFQKKVVTAEEALKLVKNGDRVVFGHACGEPTCLVEALVARAPELKNVEIVHMVAMGPARYAQPGMEGSFRHNALFVGGTTRNSIKGGLAEYTPCFFSQIPRLFTQGIMPVDVALIQIAPPDREGFCSMGISVDYTSAAAKAAHVVIAQINRFMPRTAGTKIHLDQIDFIVENDEAIIELKPAKIGPVEAAIGKNIAPLIDDGSTLQLGIGAIPDAVLLFLQDKKDLGIHSEMFSDGVLTLAESGVVNNRKKTINNGKYVATFLMGTRRLYDFVDGNQDIFMQPVDYVNDPLIIGQHENMVSINSCLQIDVMGQVNAEMIGRNQFSGVGGQVDFIRGVSRSPGGKAIIALPSTAGGGKISRIVCELDRGAAVTTSRNDVYLVATEYGVVDLRGKCIRERAKALIGIGHPEFRELLTEQARNYGII